MYLTNIQVKQLNFLKNCKIKSKCPRFSTYSFNYSYNYPIYTIFTDWQIYFFVT